MQLDSMRGFAWAKLINARPFKSCGRYLTLVPDNPAARLAGVVDAANVNVPPPRKHLNCVGGGGTSATQ